MRKCDAIGDMLRGEIAGAVEIEDIVLQRAQHERSSAGAGDDERHRKGKPPPLFGSHGFQSGFERRGL